MGTDDPRQRKRPDRLEDWPPADDEPTDTRAGDSGLDDGGFAAPTPIVQPWNTSGEPPLTIESSGLANVRTDVTEVDPLGEPEEPRPARRSPTVMGIPAPPLPPTPPAVPIAPPLSMSERTRTPQPRKTIPYERSVDDRPDSSTRPPLDAIQQPPRQRRTTSSLPPPPPPDAGAAAPRRPTAERQHTAPVDRDLPTAEVTLGTEGNETTSVTAPPRPTSPPRQHPVAQVSAPARAARPLSSPAGETRRPELGARPTTSRSRDTLTGPVVAVPPVDLRNEPTASQELAPTAEGSHSHQHARDLEQTAAHLPVDPAEQLGDDATTRAHRRVSVEPPTAATFEDDRPVRSRTLPPQAPHSETRPSALARTASGERPLRHTLPPPPAGPQSGPVVLDPLPLDKPLPESNDTWLADYGAFRRLAQKLARLGGWQQLAALTYQVLDQAHYATNTTRTALLLDLARVLRDRLNDRKRTEQAFSMLLEQEPANGEALGYIAQIYEERGEWLRLYRLLLNAVEASWDEQERLDWTREAARIARDQLGQLDLAVLAWERLWLLGDAADQVGLQLGELYRQSGRWSDLATFLRQRANREQGARRVLTLRELAEVNLSAERAPSAAERVLREIVQQRAADPVATLQLARAYAQRGDWESLAQLAQGASEGDSIAYELRQLVADALWQAGQQADAVAVYDVILTDHPGHRLAIERKRSYLADGEMHDELIALIEEQAESTSDQQERRALLREAAELAQANLPEGTRAISLWKSYLAANPHDAQAYGQLAAICRAHGDDIGYADAIAGQIDRVADDAERIELLATLGQTAIDTLDDLERAQQCFARILSIDPNNIGARDALIDLHKRRQTFSALDQALERQIWLSHDPERTLALARDAATNLDENIDDRWRAVQAWNRVLDYAPNDTQALRALERHYDRLKRPRELIAILERQIRSASTNELRLALARRVATINAEIGDSRAATATYERMLRWNPTEVAAVDALCRLHLADKRPERAVAVVEHACAYAQSSAERIALLQRLTPLLSEQHTARFFHLRRLSLYSLSADLLQELEATAEAAGDVWNDMAIALEHLASVQTDPAQRTSLLAQLAGLYERRLDSRSRSYLALQTALLLPASPSSEAAEDHQSDQLEELARIARSTRRQEDLLSVLNRLTFCDMGKRQRLQALRQRATICEKDIKNAQRAMGELLRALLLDGSDSELLQRIEKLAKKHKLWRDYDGALAQLQLTADRTSLLNILRQRERIAHEEIGDNHAAFSLALQRFRLDPDDVDLLRELTEISEQEQLWDWFLPVFEATQRAGAQPPSATELAVTAALYEDKIGDADRAFELYSEAFLLDRQMPQAIERLEQLAEKTGRYETLVSVLRLAASQATEQTEVLELLGRITEIYSKKLDDHQSSINVHRRITQLDQTRVESLGVLIDWHRQQEQWRDLRDRLQQWMHLAPEAADRAPRLLEIAQLCQEHLDDPAAAIDAYGMLLDLDAEHQGAKEALASLVTSDAPAKLKERHARLRLRGAANAEANQVRLELAQLLRNELSDPEGAIGVLNELVALEGPAGPGFAELKELLAEQGEVTALISLLLKRAELGNATSDKLETLDEALELCRTQLDEAQGELREQTYRAVLKLRPDDLDVQAALAHLLRSEERFDELKPLLTKDTDATDAVTAVDACHQLASIYLHIDQDLASAKMMLEKAVKRDQSDAAAELGLAALSLNENDLASYRERRTRRLPKLSPPIAAYTLCHLAELADEQGEPTAATIELYRKALTHDRNCEPAKQALKAIGRRRENLRPEAALLPEAGERDLSLTERALRLVARGDAVAAASPTEALDWYQRAVIVDINCTAGWKALARLLRDDGELAGCFDAHRQLIAAFRRTQRPSAQSAAAEAQLLLDAASIAKATGEAQTYQSLVARAYAVASHSAVVSLAHAEIQSQSGNTRRAHQLLDDTLLRHDDQLGSRSRLAAFRARGDVLRKLGQPEKALDDYRQALEIDPLDPSALQAMGELQAEQGQYPSAIEHLIRAAVLVKDPAERARIYYQIGLLWEDKLDDPAEAGACYEAALANGAAHRDLLHRALAHYQRSGRLSESLAVVEGLLETAKSETDLTTLWQVRGEIYACNPSDVERAIEAFDMALSYDPHNLRARDGLTEVLEKKRDWEQMLQVLEAGRDVGPPEQQARTLLRMATVALDRLSDQERGEQLLKDSCQIELSLGALTRLENLYRSAQRSAELRDIVGLLVRFGPPWTVRLLEIGRELITDHPVWAWTLLAPFLGVSQLDTDTKAVIQAMRKQHEQPEVAGLAVDKHARLLPRLDNALSDVLAELQSALEPLGIGSATDVAEESNVVVVGPQTSAGRAFSQAADAWGVPGAELYRTQDLTQAVQPINSRPHPAIVVRSDLLQQAVHAEANFLFGYALFLLRPDHRALAALSNDERIALVTALWQVLGYGTKPQKGALAERIVSKVNVEVREGWRTRLAHLADRSAAEVAQDFWDNLERGAIAAGLLTGPDLRQAFRMLSRIDTRIPRPRVVARPEDMDEYIAQSVSLQHLVSFAAAPEFGQLLAALSKPSEESPAD